MLPLILSGLPLPCSKVMTLGHLVRKFENQGVVNIGVLEHGLAKNESGAIKMSVNTKVCFALDTLRVRKKQKAGQVCCWPVFPLAPKPRSGGKLQRSHLWRED